MERFIDSADDLRSHASGEISKPDFDLIFDFIERRLPQIHAKSVVDLSNIESIFSLLEMGRLIGWLPSTDDKEVDQAVRSMRRVLVETLEMTCQFRLEDDRHWRPSEPYEALASVAKETAGRSSAPSIAFITFNYDIGLDFALHWSNLSIDYGTGTSVPGSVPLLKLHGSLNWLLCPSCHTIQVVDLHTILQQQPRRRSSDSYPILVRHTLTGQPAHCHDNKHDGQPAVVPPSWNKTQYHEYFGRIWQRAAQEIAEASEVTVIGYSFPKSDAFFRDLLALGFAGGNRLRRFTVVDPQQEVCDRFQELLGPEVRGRFQPMYIRFEDYVHETITRNRGVFLAR